MSRRRKIAAKRSRSAGSSVAESPGFYVPAGLALILLATCAVYWPALSGAVLWDDDANMTRPELQSINGLYRIWFEPGATQQYYPLLHTAFWIEHRLWGDSPFGYHLVNVVWHMVSIVLFYAILRRLKIPGALLAAAIFALHPVMVESVAWITEQKNTLSTMFYLSAVLAYVHFDESRKSSHYLASLVLFILALCSKTAVVTLPPALLVILWWQRGTLSWRRDVLPTAPFFMFACLAGVITCWVEWNFVGAVGAEFEFNMLQRLLLAGRAVWFYLSKLVWPVNLIFIYPRWTPDLGQWWQWVYPIAAIAATIALWLLRKRWRAPLAGWLFYCGTLLPMLPFLNQYLFMYTFVSDHFQYVASLGMFALAAAGAALALARLPQTGRRAGAAAGVLLLGALAVLASRQCRMYADPITLYQITIDRNPECWMAYNNLGLTLQGKGDYQAAIESFNSSIRINPAHAKAYNNLGNVLKDARRLPEAIDAFRSALTLKADDPVIHNNLGATLIHSGQFAEASEQLAHALRLSPGYAEAHNNMGLAVGFAGQVPEAIEHFQQALNLNPNDANAHNNWGIFLSRSGNFQEAVAHYAHAITLQPDRADFHSNLADSLRLIHRPQEALEHYATALRLKPDFMQAYAGLAQALALAGRSNDAVAMANKAIELARSTGKQAEAAQMEEWLQRHQAKMQRSGSVVDPTRQLPPLP